MKRRIIALVAAALAAGSLPARAQATSKKAETSIESQEPVKSFGARGTKWSEPTLKAATKPEHTQQLDAGRPDTIKGQLVEFSCFMQLKKADPSHVACATDGVRKNGQMVAVLDESNDLYVILAEEHDPRRNGQTSVRGRLVDSLHKPVSVTGLVTQHGGVKTIFMRTIEGAQ